MYFISFISSHVRLNIILMLMIDHLKHEDHKLHIHLNAHFLIGQSLGENASMYRLSKLPMTSKLSQIIIVANELSFCLKKLKNVADNFNHRKLDDNSFWAGGVANSLTA